MIKRVVHLTYKAARRIVVTVLGVSVLLVGFAMIVLPGPAIIVIPVGLTILSIEFTWARLWLKRLRESIRSRSADIRGKRAENHRR